MFWISTIPGCANRRFVDWRPSEPPGMRTRSGASLQALTEAAGEADTTPERNLLHLAVQAARVRATVGEISDALEAVWGRHRASSQTVSGVYERMYVKKR